MTNELLRDQAYSKIKSEIERNTMGKYPNPTYRLLSS
jgi:hypothetical protein